MVSIIIFLSQQEKRDYDFALCATLRTMKLKLGQNSTSLINFAEVSLPCLK